MPPISRLEVAQVQGQRAEAVPFEIAVVLPFSPVRWLYRVWQLVGNDSNVTCIPILKFLLLFLSQGTVSLSEFLNIFIVSFSFLLRRKLFF